MPVETAGYQLLRGVEEAVHRRVVGQDDVIEGLLIALITGGHVLLEGLPGLAKTLLVRSPRRSAAHLVSPDPVYPGSPAR